VIRERDERDRMRETAPLRRAEGAFRLDTTHLGVGETLECVMEHIRTTGRRAGVR
jgi:cytidylate kinase